MKVVEEDAKKEAKKKAMVEYKRVVPFLFLLFVALWPKLPAFEFLLSTLSKLDQALLGRDLQVSYWGQQS